ncbi:probable G-protein coupled receptor Mth-like 11 isoform X2 [Drosophila montana]
MKNVAVAFGILSALIVATVGDLPGCDYFDTVDLTNSHKFENGTYLYEDILIPKEKVDLYDYQILFNGEREKVLEHTRGCACEIKSCVRFCCDPQKLLVKGEGKCEGNINLNYSSFLNITMHDGTEVEKDVMEFIVQKHLPVPCKDHLLVNAAGNEKHGWTLFENGTLVRHFDGGQLSKRDYCLQPIHRPDSQLLYKLEPHHCLPPIDKTSDYIQTVSIFFMAIIIVVYLFLPNFKSIHGKCCTCYFTCLTLSFLLHVIVTFGWVDTVHSHICYLIGYSGYYVIMATFLWLLLINYNLWKTFNNIGVRRRSRFTNYNIFVWSVAAIFLIITCLADFLYEVNENEEDPNMFIFKPGVGIYSCWIITSKVSAMIYFYGPIFLLIVCNTTFFIKTAMRIFVQNKNNKRQLKKTECQRNLRNLTNFEMFFRLFIIVGVMWLLEIISYLCLLFNVNSMWVKFADMLTSAQGVILFVVTIIKKDVLRSIAERIVKRKSRTDMSLTSTSTQPPLTEICFLPKTER